MFICFNLHKGVELLHKGSKGGEWMTEIICCGQVMTVTMTADDQATIHCEKCQNSFEIRIINEKVPN
jgi:uncharacterized CHY-type Zn-finger protein